MFYFWYSCPVLLMGRAGRRAGGWRLLILLMLLLLLSAEDTDYGARAELRLTRRTARSRDLRDLLASTIVFGQRQEGRRSHHDHPNSVLYMWQGYRKQMGSIFGTSTGRVHRRVSLPFKISSIDKNLPFRTCLFSDALDALGLKRYCCRRMLLGHVDLIEKLLNYAPLEK